MGDSQRGDGSPVIGGIVMSDGPLLDAPRMRPAPAVRYSFRVPRNEHQSRAIPKARFSSDRHSWRGWPVLVYALVGVTTFLVFLPALGHGFVNWDDEQNIVDNTAYRGLSPAQLKWMLTTFHLGPYQPLSWMTLGMDYLLWGMNPFGYHLTNVLLHAIAAGL